MTFQEFEQLCNSAVTTGMVVTSPCPIVIGDPAGLLHASYIALDRRPLVEFREQPDNAALRSFVGSIRLSYEAVNNETVITPVTTGAGV